MKKLVIVLLVLVIAAGAWIVNDEINERIANLKDKHRAEVSVIKKTLSRVEQERDDARQQRDNARGELQSTTRRLRTSESTLSGVRRSYRELESTAGSLPDMTSEIERLEAEIARLKKELEPLRVRASYTHTGGFYCTGSMEPVITCLDRATWLTDFDVEDIVAGTIIAFSQNSPCVGARGGFNVAHRVISIDNSSPFNPRYLTKGDAVESADPCTIVFSDIEGYVIAIHKNVVMANAELRENVNTAKAAYEAALDKYYGAGFYVESLYNEAVTASEYYRCWYDNAWTSEYPGHIPHACNREDLARWLEEMT